MNLENNSHQSLYLLKSIKTFLCLFILGGFSYAVDKGSNIDQALPDRRVVIVQESSYLQEIVDNLASGTMLILKKGIYLGPITIDKPLTIKGEEGVVIRSLGKGTTMLVSASNVIIENITIDGSGSRYDLQDAAIAIKKSHNCFFHNNVITNATYGVVVEQSKNIHIQNNLVYGNGEDIIGLRGDGIRIWETSHSIIEKNEVKNSRDIIIWYSPNNIVRSNKIIGSRYGTHFMYSHSNTLEQNTYISNVVGTFVMYSRNLNIAHNVFLHASGAAGYGIGVKESGNLFISNNRVINNTIGFYIDTSPYDPREKNTFIENNIEFCDTGIWFHGSPKRSFLVRNSFNNNMRQVEVDGGGNAMNSTWKNNYFDTYIGYDLDKNNKGDIPYELRSLSDDLVSKYPVLSFFKGTIAFTFINTIGKLLPLFKPRLILKDESPLIQDSKTQKYAY